MGSTELPPDVLAGYMAWNKLQQDKAKKFQGLFVGLLGAAMLVNLLSRLDHRLDVRRAARSYESTKAKGSVEEHVNVSLNSAERVLRAGVAAYHKYLVYTQLPFLNMSIMDSLVIVSYAACMFGILFGDAPDLTQPQYSPGWSNRAGLMVFASLPWVVLLAGKNSPVILLTGLPYERLNIFHKYTGRLTVLLALIHGGQKMTALGSARLSIPFLRWGVAGLSIIIALFGTSHRWSMRTAYELWYALHFSLAAGLLLALWYHMPSQRDWLYATVAFWCFERAARLTRVVLVNGLWRLRSSTSRPAYVEVITSNMLRVTVDKGDFPLWAPGSHAYIHVPFMGWSTIFPQSHPFTIASIPASTGPILGKSAASSSQTLGDFQNAASTEPAWQGPSGESIGLTTMNSSERAKLSQPSFSLSDGTLTFFVRARKGWTRQLYKHVAAHGSLARTLLLDGPYSGAQPISAAYETVVFFAGGSGVSWTTAMLLGLLQQARSEPAAVSVRRIVWIWSLRADEQGWAAELLRAIPRPPTSIDLDIRLHLTGETTASAPLTISHVPVANARPDVDLVLRSIIQDARGRVWVGASGPAGLLDAVRHSARRAVNPGKMLRGQMEGQVSVHLGE